MENAVSLAGVDPLLRSPIDPIVFTLPTGLTLVLDFSYLHRVCIWSCDPFVKLLAVSEVDIDWRQCSKIQILSDYSGIVALMDGELHVFPFL